MKPSGAIAAVLLAVSATTGFAQGLPRAKPEAVGLSSERLGRLDAAIGRDLAEGSKVGAVVAVADPVGGHRLVACVVADGTEVDLTALLRRVLAEWLPEPLVPSSWLELPELPRTPNGKLDRRGLTRLAAEQGGSSAVEEAPETPVEQALAAIFGEVLGTGPVGRTDSFFHLGAQRLPHP